MLLTAIFRYFGLDLDSESDIRMSNPSDAIYNDYITRLGYEHDGRHWIEKVARALAVVDVETDKEAKMDIQPSLSTAPPLPYSPLPHDTSSSSDRPEWYHKLSQHIDT